MSTDVLRDGKKQATLCAFCPKMCRFSCSVAEAEGREAVTPWGKMSLLYLAQNRQASLDEPGALKALEACTGCGACVESCAHGNPVAETLFVARGAAGSPRAQAFREAFERTGDVKGRSFDDVLARLPRSASAKVAYFPGCTRLKQGAEVIERDLEALRVATGADVAVCDLPAGVRCCGYPLYADGQVDVLEKSLPKLMDALSEHRVVVTPDPGCAYMMSVVSSTLAPKRKQERERPRVLPLVEVLAERAERFAGRAEGLSVRYHDPCYLGRRGRTFEAPRRLLAAATGKRPLEFAMSHDAADCSGSGGLYPLSSPDGAKRTAERRVHEDGNAHVPVDAVVSACPSACRGLAKSGARVLDIVDVVLGRV